MTYYEHQVNIPITDSIKTNAKNDIITCSESSFSEALYHICKLIIDSPDSKEESFMIDTCNHAMSVKIKCEADKISIMFYDPNETNTYKMIELSSIEHVKQLSIDSLMSKVSRFSYKIANFSNIIKGKFNDEINMSFIRYLSPK